MMLYFFKIILWPAFTSPSCRHRSGFYGWTRFWRSCHSANWPSHPEGAGRGPKGKGPEERSVPQTELQEVWTAAETNEKVPFTSWLWGHYWTGSCASTCAGDDSWRGIDTWLAQWSHMSSWWFFRHMARHRTLTCTSGGAADDSWGTFWLACGPGGIRQGVEGWHSRCGIPSNSLFFVLCLPGIGLRCEKETVTHWLPSVTMCLNLFGFSPHLACQPPCLTQSIQVLYSPPPLMMKTRLYQRIVLRTVGLGQCDIKNKEIY